jgi:hypothetical protein
MLLVFEGALQITQNDILQLIDENEKDIGYIKT